MFERFTDRARKVMALANQEAQRFNHEYIGTEHILLGIIREGSGTAANALKNLNIDPRKVRLEVDKLVKSGPELPTLSKLPQTPRCKRAIELAMESARKLGHNYVGTEHLLLGLIAEQDSTASMVLRRLGATTEAVEKAVVELLGTTRPAAQASAAGSTVFTMWSAVPSFNVAQPISLRDWFAGMIANGLPELLSQISDAQFAHHCYRVADAMLAEREKPQTPKQ